jgi:hypothetical protein
MLSYIMETEKDFHRRDVLTDIYRGKALLNRHYPLADLRGLLYRLSGREVAYATIRKKIKDMRIHAKALREIFGGQASGVVHQKYVSFGDMKSLFREILSGDYRERRLSAFLQEESSAASEWLSSREIEI